MTENDVWALAIVAWTTVQLTRLGLAHRRNIRKTRGNQP